MASDDVWILGIHMTKFGKHPDKDVVDLAAEAAVGALKDGGVSMKQMGVLAAGNPAQVVRTLDVPEGWNRYETGASGPARDRG